MACDVEHAVSKKTSPEHVGFTQVDGARFQSELEKIVW